MLKVLLGFFVGVLLLAVTALGWFWFGKVPVAVNDKPLPHEGQILSIPIHARIGRDMPKQIPIMLDEDNLVAGAHVYAEKCASCHGFHGRPAQLGERMYPPAPPLWEKHGKGTTVGVSDDPPGETFWKVTNGIRLTGMPSYRDMLTQNEIWQVSLLLANADKPLPPMVLDLVRGAETEPQPVIYHGPVKKE